MEANRNEPNMAESLSNPSEKTGFPPGSVIHVGDIRQAETVIHAVDYSIDGVQESELASPEEISGSKNSDTVTWVTVEGLTDADIIGRIGNLTDMHPLVVEDILTASQRPKFEEYDHYLYVVISSLLAGDEVSDLESEQISIVIFKNSVFVFKEKSDDLFEPVLERVRTGKGRVRGMGADYLAYSLIDIIIDRLFSLTDMMDDRITLLEDSLMSSEPRPDTPLMIHKLKTDLIFIRRHVLPIKELTARMIRSQSDLIDEKTVIYLRDISDHVLRVAESIESYREILAGLSVVHMSNVSNRMNEVMKVLTVFASVFIPLTFIAGIYGMNFEYMPELGWKWAYPVLWIAFITIPIALLTYFRKKRWF
jgi:magnesium transporter